MMNNNTTRLRVWINRLLANSIWGYVLLFGVAVMVLLTVVAVASMIDREVWWNLYYALGLNPVDGDSEHRHLWLYLIIGVCGALVFGGLMVTVFTSGVERYVERIGEGQVRYRRLKGHVVVMGWNAMTANLISQLCCKWSKSMVVVVTAVPVREVHASLESQLAKGDLKRVLVYADVAGMTDASLDGLALSKAEEVYLTLDDATDGQQQVDDLVLLAAMARRREGRVDPLKVKVMINKLEVYSILQQLELPKDYISSSDGRLMLDVRMFNFYENWARLLWSYGAPHRYDQLDFEPIEAGDKRVHLVIVGYGGMGQALLLEALRICHYPGNKYTEVTIVDPRADEAERGLRRQYPTIDVIDDVRIDFRCATLDDTDLRADLETWATDRGQMLTIAICLPDADQAMCAALQLPEVVYCQDDQMQMAPVSDVRSTLMANNSRTRVLVRQSVSTQNLMDANRFRYPNLKVFGMVDEGIDISLLSDELAVTINGLYCDNLMGACATTADPANRERWELLWLQTSEASKHASRYQADRFRSLTDILRRHEGETNDGLMERLSESEHRRWVAERTLAGWRAAEVRVDALRRHNCIVPYDALSEEEKQKDRNVIAFAATL